MFVFFAPTDNNYRLRPIKLFFSTSPSVKVVLTALLRWKSNFRGGKTFAPFTSPSGPTGSFCHYKTSWDSNFSMSPHLNCHVCLVYANKLQTGHHTASVNVLHGGTNSPLPDSELPAPHIVFFGVDELQSSSFPSGMQQFVSTEVRTVKHTSAFPNPAGPASAPSVWKQLTSPGAGATWQPAPVTSCSLHISH